MRGRSHSSVLVIIGCLRLGIITCEEQRRIILGQSSLVSIFLSLGDLKEQDPRDRFPRLTRYDACFYFHLHALYLRPCPACDCFRHVRRPCTRLICHSRGGCQAQVQILVQDESYILHSSRF